MEYIQNTPKDINKNMSWLYDIINRSVEENRKNMEWMVRHIDIRDSRIEDNHRDLYEVMGKIGYMKDDLKKLVDMSQGSYIHDNMNKYHAMEEATVEHSIKDKRGKEKEKV